MARSARGLQVVSVSPSLAHSRQEQEARVVSPRVSGHTHVTSHTAFFGIRPRDDCFCSSPTDEEVNEDKSVGCAASADLLSQNIFNLSTLMSLREKHVSGACQLAYIATIF